MLRPTSRQTMRRNMVTKIRLTKSIKATLPKRKTL